MPQASPAPAVSAASLTAARCARESAQAQVHDAGAQAGPVVDRPRHAGGQTAQARRMQPPYQFHSVPSCCRRFTGR